MRSLPASTRSRLSITTVAALLVASCATSAPPPPAPFAPAPSLPAYAGLEVVNAALYQQTAAEYRALTRQVYAQATTQLLALLADASQTAALEQQPPFDHKPPAVIVDIDETILDNAAYEARLIASGQPFQQEDWDRWVLESAALPVPGALEFVQACVDRNVTVIYLSNRKDGDEADATRRNLQRLEFPLMENRDNFAFRPLDKADPLYTKGARRALVAQKFRVLMLVGDNLGDFSEEYRGTVEQRQAFVDRNAARFGQTWFMLPNAMYGSWEDALTAFDRDLDDATRHARKKAWLNTEGLGPIGHLQDH